MHLLFDLTLQMLHLALGLMEAGDEIVTLGWGEAKRRALAQPLQGTPRYGAEDLEVTQEQLAGTLRLARGRKRSPVVARLEHHERVGEHERARLRAARAVGRHELSDLTGREPLVRNRLGQTLAGLAVGARQGDQVLHRRMRDDLAP